MKILINTIVRGEAVYAKRIIGEIEKFSRRFRHDLVLIKDNASAFSVEEGEQVVANPPTGKLAFRIWERTVFLHEIRKINPDRIVSWKVLSFKENFTQTVIYPFEDGKPVLPRTKRTDYLDKISFIVFSENQKKILLQSLKSKDPRILCIYRIPEEKESPISDEEERQVKDQYSKGNEFFVASGFKSEKNCLILLKAFSIFKKWQHSGMELIISFDNDQDKIMIEGLLKNYRFSDSVVMADRNSTGYMKILLSAYAVVFGDGFNSSLDDLIFVMRSGGGAIIPCGSIYEELPGKESAFIYKPQEKDSLAQIMMEAFREETKRERIIKCARKSVSNFSTDYFTRRLQEVFQQRNED